jgi:hypothetical protein
MTKEIVKGNIAELNEFLQDDSLSFDYDKWGSIVCHFQSLAIQNRKLREAITPSSNNKSFHIGEYSFPIERAEYDEDGEVIEYTENRDIPWTSVKEIMKGIRKYAGVDNIEPIE